MPAEETPAARYRRLAQECLDVAATFPDRDQRDALLQMAQVWQRLADQYANATSRSTARASPEGRRQDKS